MPGGALAADHDYVVDQTQVKLLSAVSTSYDPYETFIKEEPRGSDMADAGGRMASAGDPGGRSSSWWQRIAGRMMGGGPPAGMDPGGDDGASISDQAKTLEKMLRDQGLDVTVTTDEDGTPTFNIGGPSLVDARPEVTAIPPKPASRPGMSFESTKTAAVAEARKNLIKTILATNIDEELTIGDEVDVDAESADWTLDDLQVVAMTWLDADRLEVEIQISVENLLIELEDTYPEADLSALEDVDQDKCFTAKGVGNFGASRNTPPDSRTRRPVG